MEYFFLKKQFGKQKFIVPGEVIAVRVWLVGSFVCVWVLPPPLFFFPFLIADTFETLQGREECCSAGMPVVTPGRAPGGGEVKCTLVVGGTPSDVCVT